MVAASNEASRMTGSSCASVAHDSRQAMAKGLMTRMRPLTLTATGTLTLVLGRPLDALDDDHLNRALCRFELQSELLLNRGEQIRRARIDRRQFHAGRRWRSAGRGRERQLERPQSGEARTIDDLAAHASRYPGGELREPHAVEHEPARLLGEPAQDGRAVGTPRRSGR